MSDLTAAILFVIVVGVIVVLGVLVGIIVAGRMDRLMAPRPPKRADDGSGPAAASAGAGEPVAAPSPEEEQS